MRKARGFTLIELLIVVAVIAIIAAVAIPGLLRSRVSANEAATIGDIRAVISAQAAYNAVNGGLYDGNLGCLTDPQGCIPSYPAAAPNFLDSNMAALNTKSGYSRLFAGGTPPGIIPPNVSPTSVNGYKYDALPVVLGADRRPWLRRGPQRAHLLHADGHDRAPRAQRGHGPQLPRDPVAARSRPNAGRA